MALAEGAPRGVLAGQPDRRRLAQQRAEGERFRRRPVDAFAGIDHLSLGLELTDDLGIDMDVRRHLGNRVADFLEEVEFDRRAAAPIVAGSDLQAGPLAPEPVARKSAGWGKRG